MVAFTIPTVFSLIVTALTLQEVVMIKRATTYLPLNTPKKMKIMTKRRRTSTIKLTAFTTKT
jgi:hypothetical protein